MKRFKLGPFAMLCAAVATAAPSVSTPVAAQERPGSGSAPVASPASQRHFPPDEDLMSRIRPLVKSGRARGIVLGVLEADGSTRILSIGSGGPGTRPLGPRSVFEMGSISKLFTATLLARMVETGDVSLTDPVSRYLPDSVRMPSRDGREITLLDLATHRSGLPRMPVSFDYPDENDPHAHFEVEDLHRFLSAWELERTPGEEYVYSNLGYGLLGHALARAAGDTYQDLVRRRVLQPLGLDMSGYSSSGAMERWMTRGHDAEGNVVPHWSYTSATAGGGGIRSTAEDMLTFLRANARPPEQPIDRAIRATHQPRAQAGDDQKIGMGWLMRSRGHRRFFWMGGDTGGYQNVLAFDPERGTGIVVLSNSDGRDARLLMTALDLLVPPGGDSDAADLPLTAEQIARYEGTYDYESRGQQRELRVYGEGDRLKAQMVAGPLLHLQYQGGHEFFVPIGPGVRIVFDVRNGRAEGFTIFQGGQELPGVRTQ